MIELLHNSAAKYGQQRGLISSGDAQLTHKELQVAIEITATQFALLSYHCYLWWRALKCFMRNTLIFFFLVQFVVVLYSFWSAIPRALPKR